MPLHHIPRPIDYIPPPGLNQAVTRLETPQADYLNPTSNIPLRAWNRPLTLPPEDPSLNLCARHRVMNLQLSDFGPRRYSKELPPEWYLGTYDEIAERGGWCKLCWLVKEGCEDVVWGEGCDVVMTWVGDVRWRQSKTSARGGEKVGRGIGERGDEGNGGGGTDVVVETVMGTGMGRGRGRGKKMGEKTERETGMGMGKETDTETEIWETLALRVRSVMIGRMPPFTPFDIVPLAHNGEGELWKGRRMKEGGQIDVDRVKEWLRCCGSWHGEECSHIIKQQQQSQDSKGAMFDPFIRLIDLEEKCLVEKKERVQYVALSYVWGRVKVFKTLEENINQLKIPRGVEERRPEFPRSIQDAMTLAQQLGYRYIWIDSICIIQDDDTDVYTNHDKKHQIGQMGNIYQYADLTIVAASGEDANAGLPGVQPGTAREHKQKVVKLSDDLTVMNRSIAWPDALLRTTWEERGWTYQERILSLRYMYFVDGTVHFQCQRATWSEDFCAESPDLMLSAADQVVQFSHIPSEVPPAVELRPNLKFQLKRYPELVGQYTCRNMTFITDRVNGIQGILNVIRDHFFGQDVEFVHGMPTGKLLHPGLLWRPRLEPKRIQVDKNQERPLWPSWSWAGWTIPVYYDYGADFSGNDTGRYQADITLSPSDSYFLHLTARVGRFRLMIEDRGNEDAVPPLPRVRPTRLTRYAITHATNPDDEKDDEWIGTIWLTWAYRRKFVEHQLKLISRVTQEFIIFSDAEGGFEREELVQAATAEKREVVNVMMIERKEEMGTNGRVRIERAGVGRMYKDVWERVEERWERFELG